MDRVGWGEMIIVLLGGLLLATIGLFFVDSLPTGIVAFFAAYVSYGCRRPKSLFLSCVPRVRSCGYLAS